MSALYHRGVNFYRCEAGLRDGQISRCLRAALSIGMIAGALTAGAQTQTIGTLAPPATPTIFWSQVNTFVGITPSLDFVFLASGTPGADSARPEFVLGPNLDIALWNFLTHLKTNNPERSKYLTFRVGYRYAKNLYKRETTHEDRRSGVDPTRPTALGLPDRGPQPDRSSGTAHPLQLELRNRLGLLRSITIGKFAITPYAQAEAFYNCSFAEWSQYTYQFGAISRITPRIEIDTWYRRRTSLTEPVLRANLTGVKLLLFFHRVDR